MLYLTLLLLSLRACAVVKTSRCSTWTQYNHSSNQCECSKALKSIIQCNVTISDSVFSRIDYCISVDKISDTMVCGLCKFKYQRNVTQLQRVYSELPQDPDDLTDAQCGQLNREGLLCSRCKSGHAPPVYLFDLKCINCSDCFHKVNTFFWFVVVEILPMTVLYLIMRVFRVNITSGPMAGYILFCQAHINSAHMYPNLTKFLFSRMNKFTANWNRNILLPLSGIWYFTFFAMFQPSLCFGCHFNNLSVILMQYISVIYILILIALTHLLGRVGVTKYKESSSRTCKAFHECFTRWRRNWSASDSTIHAFATFIALFFSKIGAISFQLLLCIPLHNMNGSVVKTVVAFEPAIEMYSRQHLPYLIAAYAPLIAFGILPAVVLCLYPNRHFQCFLSHCCGPRRKIALSMFVETFYCGYRDGLEGGRDYSRLYPVAMLAMVGCIITFTNCGDTLPENYFFLLFPVFIVLAFSVSYLRPCKTLAMNMSLSFHLITIGLCAAVLALWMQDFILDAYSLETFLTVLLTLPHAVMLLWLIYQIMHRGNFIGKCFQKIRQVTLGENEFLLNRFG